MSTAELVNQNSGTFLFDAGVRKVQATLKPQEIPEWPGAALQRVEGWRICGFGDRLGPDKRIKYASVWGLGLQPASKAERALRPRPCATS